jgi:hypothetical protein
MAEQSGLHPEDVLPVRSRVSWSAVFAGAVVALAVYLVVTLLGAAIGLSISGRVTANTVGIGAAVWAVASIVLALFVGGCVTTTLAVGETKTEAMIHGILLWGVVFAAFFWLMGVGVRSGFGALAGMAYLNEGQDRSADSLADAARRAGVPEERIDALKREWATAPESVRKTLEEHKDGQSPLSAAGILTWLTLVGVVLSLAAAIFGALAGSGPTVRLVAVRMWLAPQRPLHATHS